MVSWSVPVTLVLQETFRGRTEAVCGSGYRRLLRASMRAQLTDSFAACYLRAEERYNVNSCIMIFITLSWILS